MNLNHRPLGGQDPPVLLSDVQNQVPKGQVDCQRTHIKALAACHTVDVMSWDRLSLKLVRGSGKGWAYRLALEA